MVFTHTRGRSRGRLQLLTLALLLSVGSLGAESGKFAGYITYSPNDISTGIAIAGENLGYLREVASLLAPGDSTLLRRVDSSHWAALTRLSASWLLQIHDEDVDYNCRALVDPKSGRLTIQRGVVWTGRGREADAARVATLAIAYIDRLRNEVGVFGAPSKDAKEVGFRPESAAWKRLVLGNLRWSQNKSIHPDQGKARLAETAASHHPFAIIVTCSDSRIPPDLIFDQGIGDLFVVRTAGEVVGELELGSIEYAVEYLGAGFILVLGHQRCNAVDAAIKGGELPPDIAAIAARIAPAVDRVKNLPGDILDNAARENAREVAATIAKAPIMAEAIGAGRLSIKAAYYDLDFGEVTELK